MGDFVDAVAIGNLKAVGSMPSPYPMQEALAMLAAMLAQIKAPNSGSSLAREVEATPKGLPTEFGQRKIKV